MVPGAEGEGCRAGYPLPPLSSGTPVPGEGETGRRSWPHRPHGCQPIILHLGTPARALLCTGRSGPFLLLSSPSDVAGGGRLPTSRKGWYLLMPKHGGGTTPVFTAGPGHAQPRALAGGFLWVPHGVAPGVGTGAVLQVLQWAGGVPDPPGRWGVCARLGTTPMPGAGTKAGDIALGYRGTGRGMQWGVISPMESLLAGTVWHSTHFTLASYWKIEPFFIEK